MARGSLRGHRGRALDPRPENDDLACGSTDGDVSRKKVQGARWRFKATSTNVFTTHPWRRILMFLEARPCSAMLYTFRSKAAGEVIMMGSIGDELLRIIGKEPASRGVIEPAMMPAAMLALEEAITREKSQAPETETDSAEQDPHLLRDEPVTLRQRAWPLGEMLKRAHAENSEIVWGT